MSDRPRLLHHRSELGYTDRPADALIGEPEAVDAQTQRRLTQEAALRQKLQRRAVWLDVRERLGQELETLRAAFGPLVADEARAIRRSIDRIDAKLR